MEQALLTSAAEILETEGPEGLSVRKIAAAAGVAPMGVYNHFESKFGIVEALFIEGFERLRDATESIGEIYDPYAAMREGCRRYRALALAQPMVYRLMFLQGVPGFEPSQQALEVAARAFDALVAAVQRAMASRVIAEASPTEIAQLIWASIHGWMSLELLGIGFVEDKAAGYDRLCTSLLLGLRP
jgi:AcrR family transcriptional regulator